MTEAPMDKITLVGAVKASTIDSATFEGWASTSDLDRQGDIVEPAAFVRSLPAFLRNGPIFWSHAEAYDPTAKPIGKAIDGRISDGGLFIKAKWANTPEAVEVRSLVTDGIVNSLSIGFNPVQMHRDASTGVNVITDLELLEVSIVTIPANVGAVITAAKHLAELPAVEPRRKRAISRLG
jgi:HK97 family phage prohead protease